MVSIGSLFNALLQEAWLALSHRLWLQVYGPVPSERRLRVNGRPRRRAVGGADTGA